jgi:5-enolpyruvylshikimate-3-phosphate synthase
MPDSKYKNKSGPRQDGVQGLEEDLVRILGVRVQGMANAAARRKDRGKPAVDPAMEKRLWRAWENLAIEHGLDAGALRRLFAMLNDLAYAKAQGGATWRSSALNLTPERIPEFIDLTGPGDTRLSRLLTAAAAASGGSATISPVIMNDPLYELVQALAQAGAALERREDAVTAMSGKLAFGERTVFSGADELNLYIMMALAAPHSGRYTISGTGAAKAVDLSPVAAGFARLGVRVTSVEPKSKGLPVRIETPGIERAELRLPENFPPDAALALAVAGPSFPEGMSLVWEPDWSGRRFLDEARALFRMLGVPAEEGEHSLNIPQGYRVSGVYVPPPDPVLSAYVLGLARSTGRRVRLTGRWPESPGAAAAAALLESAGLSLNVAREAVTAEPSSEGAGPIDAERLGDCLPLALALATGMAEGTVIKAPEGHDEPAAEAFVNAFGAELRSEGGALKVGGGHRPDKDTYLAPSPYYALAALVACPARPGVRLVNPGILSEIWPGAVKLYKTLFRATSADRKESKGNGGGSKGKRIRL